MIHDLNVGFKMKKKLTIYFTVGFSIGLLYWLLSPLIFGKHEPWDYSLSLYLTIVSIAGMIIGILAGKYFWAGIIGLYIGQCLVALFRPQPNVAESTPIFIGLLGMALWAFPSVIGGLLGWGVRWLKKTRKSNKDTTLNLDSAVAESK